MYWIHTTTQAINLELVTDVYYQPPKPDSTNKSEQRPKLTLYTCATYGDEQSSAAFWDDEALAIWAYIKSIAQLNVNIQTNRAP